MKGLLVVLVLAILGLIGNASAGITRVRNERGGVTVNVTADTPVADINALVSLLQAGDVLQFLPGVYVNVALDLTGLLGTAGNLITIRGIACGTELPILRIDTDVLLSANVLLGLGSSFIKLENLLFTQVGSGLVNGIQFLDNATNIILQNLVLNGINGNGIDLSGVNDLVNILINHNVLSNIGLLQVLENPGVGILVGGLLEPVTNVLNIQIVDNVLHDLFGNVGSAIQVLLGVVAPQVLDNVIWNAPLGLGLSLNLGKRQDVGAPVLAAVQVVTGIADDLLSNLPLVARNLILDTSGLANGLGVTVALQVGAGTQVVNNVIINADIGLDLVLGGDLTTFINTLIAHNTVFNVTTVALRLLDGLVSDTLRIVNNVLAVGVGLVGVVLQLVDGLLESVAVILNNVVQGLLGVNLTSTVAGLIGTVDGVLGNVVGLVDQLLYALVGGNESLVNELLGQDGVVDQLVDELLGQDGVVDSLLNGLLGGDNGLLGGLLNLGGDGSGLLDVALGNVLGTVLGDLNNVLGGVLGAVDPLLSGVLGSVNDLLNNLLGDINNLLGGLLADVNLLLCHVLALVNSLLRSLLGGVIGNLHPLLGGILGPLDKILNGVLGGLLSGNLVLTADVDAALKLVLADVNALLTAVLSDVDLLLADVLGLVDFGGNVRVGRWTIGALQVGVSLDLNVILGFKSGVVVPVPCVQPTPGPACPARRASVSSTA